MDAALEAIAIKINEDIRDKAVPNPDPDKIGAVDTADILDGFVNVINGLYAAVVPVPSGIEWVTPPGDPVFGAGTITETASAITVDGAFTPVAAATLSEPFAATGKHRLDLVAINYDAAAHPELPAAFYVLIQGDEVLASETVAVPSLPINHLLVRQVLVNDNAAAPRPSNPVKSVIVNNATPTLPDPMGALSLDLTATTLPYTPADSNNSTGFFAGLLTSGMLSIKAALDRAVERIKTNKADIATNTSAIAANTSAITANTTAITNNTTAIAAKMDKPEAFAALGITSGIAVWATGGKYENNKTLLLDQNVALQITGAVSAATGTLIIKQDATGGRIFTPPASSSPATLSINTAAGSETVLGWKYDGAKYRWAVNKNT